MVSVFSFALLLIHVTCRPQCISCMGRDLELVLFELDRLHAQWTEAKGTEAKVWIGTANFFFFFFGLFLFCRTVTQRFHLSTKFIMLIKHNSSDEMHPQYDSF